MPGPLFMHSPAFLMRGPGDTPGDLDLDDHAAGVSSAVPGPLQTVQRAEYCGFILGLQALMPVHLRVDNKNVCHRVATLLKEMEGFSSSFSMPLHIWYRYRCTVNVSKVKEHATGGIGRPGEVDDSGLNHEGVSGVRLLYNTWWCGMSALPRSEENGRSSGSLAPRRGPFPSSLSELGGMRRLDALEPVPGGTGAVGRRVSPLAEGSHWPFLIKCMCTARRSAHSHIVRLMNNRRKGPNRIMTKVLWLF